MQTNLLDDETAVGCTTRFHRPYPEYHKEDYNLLVPQKYTTIKDDLPGMLINNILHENSENPKTLPPGYDYDVPLSLHAESCLSEFRNIDKMPVEKKKSSTSAKDAKENEEDEDPSDLLYNAYTEARNRRQTKKS